MTFVTGYIFTQTPLLLLQNRGFLFHESQHAGAGYVSYTALLSDGQGFQLRWVQDEEAYRKTFSIEHFFPFISEFDRSKLSSKNQSFHMVDVLTEGQMACGKLRKFLKIRKQGEVWALWIACELTDQISNSHKLDLQFDYKQRRGFLVHLGPNCFDIFMTYR